MISCLFHFVSSFISSFNRSSFFFVTSVIFLFSPLASHFFIFLYFPSLRCTITVLDDAYQTLDLFSFHQLSLFPLLICEVSVKLYFLHSAMEIICVMRAFTLKIQLPIAITLSNRSH